MSRTRSYKKNDEALLSLTGSMSSCSREKQWTKQEVGGTCFQLGQMWQVDSASSQPLLKPLLWGDIALWLGVLGIRLHGKISSCYTLGLYNLRILWRVSGSVRPQKHPELPRAGAPPPKQADQKNRFCGPVSWGVSWSTRVSWSAGADISWSGNRNYPYFSQSFFLFGLMNIYLFGASWTLFSCLHLIVCS